MNTHTDYVPPQFRAPITSQELIHLMAVNAELLKALQAIADGALMSGTFTHAETVLRYQEHARKAISKAKGETRGR